MNAEQLKNSILQRAVEGKLVEQPRRNRRRRQPEGEKIHRPGTSRTAAAISTSAASRMRKRKSSNPSN